MNDAVLTGHSLSTWTSGKRAVKPPEREGDRKEGEKIIGSQAGKEEVPPRS